MNKTKIPWCDWTWNPITGCSAASEGCLNCYARQMSERFGWQWGEAMFHTGRLSELKQAKPGDLVFVSSMGDFFHETVHSSWQDCVMHEVKNHPELTFLFLTKRASRMRDYFVSYVAGDPCVKRPPQVMPQNVWLGVTAENQVRAYERVPILLGIPDVAVRFVSIEPMLQEVRLNPRLDWVIAGPENGPQSRRFDPWWIESLLADCKAEGIPFFDKRNDPDVVRQFPGPHRFAYQNCCHYEQGACDHPQHRDLGDCVECPLFQKLAGEELEDLDDE